MDIEGNTIGFSEAEIQELSDSELRALATIGTEPARTPVMLYSLGFDADELLVTYAALRTYLRGLVSQDNEDFKQIQRVVKLLIALRPQVVKASKAVSLKTVGMGDRNGTE
jgi:hypothetical protein